MATLNGEPVEFAGFDMKKIGEILLDRSPNRDGRNIHLELSPDEEAGFMVVFGVKVGRGLASLIENAAERRGEEVEELLYTYNSSGHVFTTSP